ncbi:MAG: hypothetical protein HFE81_01560 [Bacilli bacterium]|nr:hypothetical protein [Bacilli bacterium]
MRERYDIWVREFMDSWKELDYQRTLKTLDKNVLYYENPIDNPCKDFDEVINLWNVVADNQKNIEYKYEIISFNEELCIVNWQMKRTMTASNIRQEIDGIFQISINDKGKCTYFKQWRFTREV